MRRTGLPPPSEAVNPDRFGRHIEPAKHPRMAFERATWSDVHPNLVIPGATPLGVALASGCAQPVSSIRASRPIRSVVGADPSRMERCGRRSGWERWSRLRIRAGRTSAGGPEAGRPEPRTTIALPAGRPLSGRGRGSRFRMISPGRPGASSGGVAGHPARGSGVAAPPARAAAAPASRPAAATPRPAGGQPRPARPDSRQPVHGRQPRPANSRPPRRR